MNQVDWRLDRLEKRVDELVDRARLAPAASEATVKESLTVEVGSASTPVWCVFTLDGARVTMQVKGMDEGLRGKHSVANPLLEHGDMVLCSLQYPALSRLVVWLRGTNRDADNSETATGFNSPAAARSYFARACALVSAYNASVAPAGGKGEPSLLDAAKALIDDLTRAWFNGRTGLAFLAAFDAAIDALEGESAAAAPARGVGHG